MAGIGRLIDRIGMVAWSVASPVGDRFAIRVGDSRNR